jgi:hypothetical protein
VWDAITGVSVAEFKGHTDWVSSAEFSSDGTLIVMAPGDKTVRVWDSVSFCERFPAIHEFRKEQSRQRPLIANRLFAGECIQALRAEYANLNSDRRTEQTAALAILMEEQEQRADQPIAAANQPADSQPDVDQPR